MTRNELSWRIDFDFELLYWHWILGAMPCGVLHMMCLHHMCTLTGWRKLWVLIKLKLGSWRYNKQRCCLKCFQNWNMMKHVQQFVEIVETTEMLLSTITTEAAPFFFPRKLSGNLFMVSDCKNERLTLTFEGTSNSILIWSD